MHECDEGFPVKENAYCGDGIMGRHWNVAISIDDYQKALRRLLLHVLYGTTKWTKSLGKVIELERTLTAYWLYTILLARKDCLCKNLHLNGKEWLYDQKRSRFICTTVNKPRLHWNKSFRRLHLNVCAPCRAYNALLLLRELDFIRDIYIDVY